MFFKAPRRVAKSVDGGYERKKQLVEQQALSRWHLLASVGGGGLSEVDGEAILGWSLVGGGKSVSYSMPAYVKMTCGWHRGGL